MHTRLTPSLPVAPLRDRILVLPDPHRDDITTAGIVVKSREGFHTTGHGGMNESVYQLGRKGTVVTVGPKVDAEQLKPGDRILFGEFEYPEYHDGNAKYLVLSDKDVCGVIE